MVALNDRQCTGTNRPLLMGPLLSKLMRREFFRLQITECSGTSGSRLTTQVTRLLTLGADQFIASNPTLNAAYLVAKSQMAKTVAYFQSIMKVRGDNIVSIPSYQCGTTTIPAYTNEAFDLFVYVVAENDSKSGAAASAVLCQHSSLDSRPITGAYYLNMGFVDTPDFNQFVETNIFMHEFIHILGFNNEAFDKFLKSDRSGFRPMSETTKVVNIAGTSYTGIILPLVLAYGREFFNCPALEALPLEDGGGSGSAGSHWEKLFFPHEILNPRAHNPLIISRFTLTLLQDSGWYEIDLSKAEPYDWGRGDGCTHFYSTPCPLGNEYCPNASEGEVCSPDFLGTSTCGSDSDFFATCKMYMNADVVYCPVGASASRGVKTDEVIGPHSRCFMTKSADANPLSPKCLPSAVYY